MGKLTHKEFENFIEETTIKLESATDLSTIIHMLHEAIEMFIPYNAIHILKIDNKKHIATTMNTTAGTESLVYPLEEKGILSQCYESHQPLLVNDIERSLLYNKNIDCLGKENIHKILIVPILDTSAEKNIVGMIWIGITKGYQQFIQQDIDDMVYFTNRIKHKLFSSYANEEEKEKSDLLVCRESKKMLQVKMERYENYFASTIHDIRTPMNAVIGFMELLIMNETDEEKRDYIDATLKSGEHIVALINDALDMSKVASGKMSLERKAFSPIDGLSDIVKLFYNTMKQKSIVFDIYIDPNLPALIVSDLHRIKQIVNNLLSNALKFTPLEGKVTLKAIYSQDKDTLEISVADTGIGIAKEKHKSIFNPYAQESNSTSREYGGTGLGLAISQQLSILLNGTLTLTSEQGEGSNFTLAIPCDTPPYTQPQISNEYIKESSIILYSSQLNDQSLQSIKLYLDTLNTSYTDIDASNPLTISDDCTILIINRKDALIYVDSIQHFLDNNGRVLFIENDLGSGQCRFEGNYKLLHNPILPGILMDSLNILVNPNQKDNFEETQINKEELKGMSVLVVDDNMINLKLMAEILKRYQLDITTTLNASEAIMALENKIFDVIFIDQNMPIMTGDEAIAEIRAMEKINGQKPATIYGLTGDTHEEIREKIIKSGADSVYTKPIHVDEVYEALLKSIQ